MQHRTLGRSDLTLAPLMFGGNVFGWTVDRSTAFRLLDMFVDHGFSAIDTADVYIIGASEGVGTSERVIGEWLAQGGGRREKVLLATKLGMDMGKGRKGLSARYMTEAVEASLARLRTDRIDLYQAHADDPETPQEETLRAFDRLVSDGKVRVIGASNFTPDRLASALDISAAEGLSRFETLQPLYNLVDRDPFESTLRDLCLERQVSVLPYFSLASGFLTGKYRKMEDLAGSARGRIVKRYLNDRGLRILDALDAVAAERNATPAQIALAWLITRPTVAAPIASASSVDQLAQMMAACRLSLSAEELDRLDSASRPD
jgi:aryl-alcohol dehydrogenase-like predicted oxidoreductase